jgi:aspartate beta-hydroxylase
MSGERAVVDRESKQLELRLAHALALGAAGRSTEAEGEYRAILRDWPDCLTACKALVRFSSARGDNERTVELLEHAQRLAPDDPKVAANLALAIARCGRIETAVDLLDTTVARHPDFHPAWFHLGRLREALGDLPGANRAWFQAIRRAQNKGLWLNEQTTPPAMLEGVQRAMQHAAQWRRNIFMESLSELRGAHGSSALDRVDRALRGYLKECDNTPADSRQRPRFLYFPDLPSAPYLDPALVPWTAILEDRFAQIQAEAQQVLDDRVDLPGFLTFDNGADSTPYLAGNGPNPAWNALFFYRHGKRYEENHLRCPETSATLDSLELCTIRHQAPEICFSVLTPGSHILPHYGVTNARVVVHLPLIVPERCALNIVGIGTHVWQEGRAMVFDDSYLHEAWNHSSAVRVILLMDAWNPHLTAVETLAIRSLVEAISDFEGEAKLS